MDAIKSLINSARFAVNGLFVDKEPWQIVTITTSSVLLSIWFFELTRAKIIDYRFGITKVFFRPRKFAEFDKIMKSDPENLKEIVANVKKRLIKSRWLKSQFCTLTVIKLKNKINYRRQALIKIQKTVRGYLVKKKHDSRIKGIRKISRLDSKLKQMNDVANQLKRDKESSINEINKLKTDISSGIAKIKKEENIRATTIDQLYEGLLLKVNQQMVALQKKVQDQNNAEEQERLKNIQEEMEREKKRKEENERIIREEEENRRKKAEMEMRREQEEELLRKQEEENKISAGFLREQNDKEALEERKYQQQLEQERHQVHELACRLAQESNGQIEKSPQLIRMSEAVKNQQAALSNNKFDLSKWKYSELRDAINTSCDIDLLEACRHEFHRRLKVYHAWKGKNRKRTTMDENERAPRSILDAAARTPHIQEKIQLNENSQRYFRIPFIRPSSGSNEQHKKGWWFAHFDGQYVARQMNLHLEKLPILLTAGKDDMQMCELSLEKTGLTHKRGAEIFEAEFNKEWERHGGVEYIRPIDRKG